MVASCERVRSTIANKIDLTKSNKKTRLSEAKTLETVACFFFLCEGFFLFTSQIKRKKPSNKKILIINIM